MQRLTRLLRRGAGLGLLAGLAVASAYIVLFVSGTTVLMLSASPAHPEDKLVQLAITPAITGLMLVCGSFLGLAPGGLLGLLIGTLIGLALSPRRLSGPAAAVVGFVIAAGVVGLLHLLLLRADPNPTLKEYLWLTIVPGLLCSAAGGWVGWRLNRD